MNILQLTVDYPPPLHGGLPRQVHGLAHALARTHAVGVVTTGVDRTDDMVQVFGTDPVVDHLPTHGLAPLVALNFGLCQGLIRAATVQRWDVVHAHDWMTAPAAVIAHQTLRIPVVASFHANNGSPAVGSAEDQARRLDWESALVQVTSRVLACSEPLRRLLLERHPNAQVRYVPNGIYARGFAGDLEVPDEPLRLLFVGRLVPYKGCQDLLRALAFLRTTWPSIQLQVVGEGFYRSELEALSRSLGVDEAVEFVGWLAGEGLVHAYHRASIVVVPSHEEAFGLVALEAMAAGRPVVATTIDAFASYIDDGETGMLAAPHNPAHLARQIERLLRDPVWRTRMVEAAKERVVPRYDWDCVVERTNETYRAIVGSHANGDPLAGHAALGEKSPLR